MVNDEEIKKLAVLLWEVERCPDGKDRDHYFRAKRILEERHRVNSVMDRMAREMAVEAKSTA
jgi:hypothetical protein